MLKKLTLAALAATFIAGSAAVANAEISDSDPSPTSSAGLRADYAARHGGDAYAYAPQSRFHQAHRNTVRVNRHR
jgi:hypothetical protein